jgi:hypothetical protein
MLGVFKLAAKIELFERTTNATLAVVSDYAYVALRACIGGVAVRHIRRLD